jgi:hypothetical protein
MATVTATSALARLHRLQDRPRLLLPRLKDKLPPVQRASGRRFVKIGGRVTPYARALMAQALGRPLLRFEDVHHINGDPADDRIENLAMISRAQHTREHWATLTCLQWCFWCGRPISKPRARQLTKLRFCSCRCSARFRERVRQPLLRARRTGVLHTLSTRTHRPYEIHSYFLKHGGRIWRAEIRRALSSYRHQAPRKRPAREGDALRAGHPHARRAVTRARA